MTIVWLVGVSMAMSLVSPLLWIPLLRHFQVIDVPNDRSSHNTPTIRGAGVAPASGVVVAAILVLAMKPKDHVAAVILIASLLAAVLGIVEDTRGLSVRFRAFLQLVLGVGMASALSSLTGQPLWFIPFISLAFAGYINVANFMDGVNGISAFHGLVAGVYFAILGTLTSQDWLLLSGSVSAAVFVAFLPWNLIRGRVFLGDSGSYLLGALVVGTGIAVFLTGSSLMLALAPAWPYLADTFVTLVSRILRREKISQSHRSHVYQQLTSTGMSHIGSAATVAAASVCCSALAFFGQRGSWQMAVGMIGTLFVLVGYLKLPRMLALSRPRVHAT